jgi:hypothetical protein
LEEISRILPRVLGRSLPWPEEHLVEILQPLWPQAVGEAIARNTRPVSFWNGTLTIATPCPSWQSQLAQMEGPLCAQINNFFGGKKVRRVRVRLQPESSPRAAMAGPAFATAEKAAAGEGKAALFANARLNQEMAEILGISYRKYFARRQKDAV